MSHSAPPPLIDLRKLRLDAAQALIAQTSPEPLARQQDDPARYLQSLLDGLCELSLIDPLTGYAARRHFHAVLESEIDRVARSSDPALLLVLRIDRLSSIVEAHGSEAGNLVVQSVARTVRSFVRPMDTLARYAPDGFALVLPDCHGKFGHAVAERIRRAVESTPAVINTATPIKVTVSIGGAFALQWSHSTTLHWTDRADEQLHEAVLAGCNRVCIEAQPDSTVSAEEKSQLFGEAHATDDCSGEEPANPMADNAF